jgi:hypothetical protein
MALLQDRVISSEGWIDHSEIPFIGEVEEVHLYFPTGLPIKDLCIPSNLGRNLDVAA